MTGNFDLKFYILSKPRRDKKGLMWLLRLPGPSLSVVFSVRATATASSLLPSKGVSAIAFTSPLWGVAVNFKIASWFKMASCVYSWPPFLAFLNEGKQRITGYHSQKTSEIIYHFVAENWGPEGSRSSKQLSAEAGVRWQALCSFPSQTQEWSAIASLGPWKCTQSPSE